MKTNAQDTQGGVNLLLMFVLVFIFVFLLLRFFVVLFSLVVYDIISDHTVKSTFARVGNM